jgi:hypothetical protein
MTIVTCPLGVAIVPPALGGELPMFGGIPGADGLITIVKGVPETEGVIITVTGEPGAGEGPVSGIPGFGACGGQLTMGGISTGGFFPTTIVGAGENR